MSKRAHEKQLERARAKRASALEQRRSQRTKMIAGVIIVGMLAGIVAIVFSTGADDTVDPVVEGDAIEDEGIDDALGTQDEAVSGVNDGDGTATGAAPCPGAEPGEAPAPTTTPYESFPDLELQDGVDYHATISTTCGDIQVDLFEDDAPLAVTNFVFLAQDDYYAGSPFHRVIPGFMIQGGDPTGTGTGCLDPACEQRLPGYTFADELDTVEEHGFDRGTLAMANAGPDTNGSQFFIVQGDASHLSTHTVFGEVTEGMDVVDRIVLGPAEGDLAIDPVLITDITIEER